ncbi:MAG: MlrC C-terminal domain-containing protein, partial [Parvibaculaceae bacterium]
FWQFPYLVALHAQSTNDWPASGLFALLPTLEAGGIASADCALGFPAADIEHCGGAFVVYGRDLDATTAVVKRLEATALAAEAAFVHRLLPCEEAVELAMARGRPGSPILLGDVQDNAGAGASADEPRLLRTLIEKGARDALAALLWDAEASQTAHKAGVGATIELSLGGRYGSDGPMTASFLVENLSDGLVHCRGAVTGDLEVNLGPMALLRVVDPRSEVRVIVASVRTQCLDRAMVEILGIDIRRQAIVALKSTNHFRADFEPLAQEVVMVAAPGAHPCDLSQVEYRRLRAGVRLGPKGKPQPSAHGRRHA